MTAPDQEHFAPMWRTHEHVQHLWVQAFARGYVGAMCGLIEPFEALYLPNDEQQCAECVDEQQYQEHTS